MRPVLHPSVQELLQINGQKFKISAPDPCLVVIDTIRPHTSLLDALCTGGLMILPKHSLEATQEGNFASAYNVATPRTRSWRAGRGVWCSMRPAKNGTQAQSLLFRIRSTEPAAAVSGRGRVPDRARSGFRRPEIPAGELDGLDNVKPENYKW
jgi:hypothetical protein